MSLVEAFGWLAFYAFTGLLATWGLVAVLSVAWLCVGLYNEGRTALTETPAHE